MRSPRALVGRARQRLELRVVRRKRPLEGSDVLAESLVYADQRAGVAG